MYFFQCQKFLHLTWSFKNDLEGDTGGLFLIISRVGKDDGEELEAADSRGQED